MTARKLSPLQQAAIVLAGFLSLVVAMGIGRFAFTPMLPLMQRDGLIGTSAGAWLASANYAGYLAGAMCAAHIRWPAPSLMRGSLAPIAIFTAAMGLVAHLLPWLALRFAAGVLSAWVLVGTSAWCLAQLAAPDQATGRSMLAGLVYAGVGAGIAIAGALCLAFAGTTTPASSLWQYLGAIAGVFTLMVFGLVWWVGAGVVAAPLPATVKATVAATSQRGLIVCYGCFGFGYILPATFIPALGRMVIDDPVLFGWAWPIFGVTGALSTILASAFLNRMSRLAMMSHCHFVMAIGAALPTFSPSLPALLVSAVCVGGTFMVITMAGYQEARVRGGGNPSRLMGLMTSAFAIGQITGPLFSALLAWSTVFDDKLSLRAGLLAASVVLAASGIWLRRAAQSNLTAQGAQA